MRSHLTTHGSAACTSDTVIILSEHFLSLCFSSPQSYFSSMCWLYLSWRVTSPPLCRWGSPQQKPQSFFFGVLKAMFHSWLNMVAYIMLCTCLCLILHTVWHNRDAGRLWLSHLLCTLSLSKIDSWDRLYVPTSSFMSCGTIAWFPRLPRFSGSNSFFFFKTVSNLYTCYRIFFLL